MEKYHQTFSLHANSRGFSVSVSFGFNSRFRDRIYLRLGYKVLGFKGLRTDLWFFELLGVYSHISKADSKQIGTIPVHKALYRRRYLDIVQASAQSLEQPSTPRYTSLMHFTLSQASSLAFELTTFTKSNKLVAMMVPLSTRWNRTKYFPSSKHQNFTANATG